MSAADWPTEIANLAAAGLVAPATPYDADRYARLRQIAQALRDGGPPAPPPSTPLTPGNTQGLHGHPSPPPAPSPLGHASTPRGHSPSPVSDGLGPADALTVKTPRIAADAAVFDPQGRLLLIQRTDSALWALPGGSAEVGNLPAAVAEREVWEETGVFVRAERLLGLYAIPNRAGPGYPLCILLFLCRYLSGDPVVTHESLDVGYFGQDALPPLHIGHNRRVADAFAALRAGPVWVAVAG